VNKFTSFGFTVRNNTRFELFINEAKEIIGLPYSAGSTPAELTGMGRVIGIIDTGIDMSHPDLENKNISLWIDEVSGRQNPYDDYGHGTHLASIAAGTGVNSSGKYKGIAPDASLIVIKACDNWGGCDPSHVALALADILNANPLPDVVSLSFGWSPTLEYCTCTTTHTDYLAVCQNIDNLIARGIPVVAAAGNYGPMPSTIGFPACKDNVIASANSYKRDLDHYKMELFEDYLNPWEEMAKLHIIINVTTDNPPQVFNIELNGSYDLKRGIGIQEPIHPNKWPATIKVQIEGEHKERKCYETYYGRTWWDPGGNKGNAFWEWEETFTTPYPTIVVEVGAEASGARGGPWSCLESRDWWKVYYNDYTCTGIPRSCDSFDPYDYNGCLNQHGCWWKGCNGRLGGLPPTCWSKDQLECNLDPSCYWEACNGIATPCDKRHQEGGKCGTPGTTGCSIVSWDKNEDIYVRMDGTTSTSLKNTPTHDSSRGPTPQGTLKPLLTAPGTDIVAARAHGERLVSEGRCDPYPDNDNYMSCSGTSATAPMISGLITLMKEASAKIGNIPTIQEITEGLKKTDRKVFSEHPNNYEGYGLTNSEKAIDYITNCNLRDEIYLDSTTNPPLCSYNYSSYSSANQKRDYGWSEGSQSCACTVPFDSYITQVSVNQKTSGDICVKSSSNILAEASIKNTGTSPQENWFVGMEFRKVDDYNIPQRNDGVYFIYSNKKSGCFGLPCPAGSGCSLVSDPNNNGILDIGETVKVKCWVPASYWGTTSGTKRIMVWVSENSLNVSGVWWSGALARTNKGSGGEDWPASTRAIVYQCTDWEIASEDEYTDCRYGDCITCAIITWTRTCSPSGCDKESKRTKWCY
jgi:hypothetical protein